MQINDPLSPIYFSYYSVMSHTTFSYSTINSSVRAHQPTNTLANHFHLYDGVHMENNQIGSFCIALKISTNRFYKCHPAWHFTCICALKHTKNIDNDFSMLVSVQAKIMFIHNCIFLLQVVAQFVRFGKHSFQCVFRF